MLRTRDYNLAPLALEAAFGKISVASLTKTNNHQMVSFSVALFYDSKQGSGRKLAITLHHSNVQIAKIYLNFAVRELRICCPLLSLPHWVVNWRKFALTVNAKVNYRELARRPW